MKLPLISLSAITALVCLGSFARKSAGNECEITNFYEASAPAKSGTKVLTRDGTLADPDLILTPTMLETGTYNVTLTRKADNIYKVETPDNYKFKYGKLYIETRYCREYANRKEVVLIVEDSYAPIKGKIHFDLKK